MATSFSFDVFLSHNAHDKVRVRRLAERLRDAGVRVWLDDWIIRPGDDIYLAVEAGLAAARILLLCLSPAALRSDWVGLERSTVLFRDPANKGRRFIPLLLAECTLPDSLRRYKYVDWRDEAQTAFEELLAACLPEARPTSAEPQDKSGGTSTFRRLRVYAFDPSLEIQLETAMINEVTLKVPWESDVPPDESDDLGDCALQAGPVGEYLEVIDYDPASGCFYAPVDLNDPYLLAQDGLAPSEGDPQFHQQMVYAVAMTTIRNFEKALGRLALWSPRFEFVQDKYTYEYKWVGHYVRRLRIYPHALRQANAFYSPVKKALLFGYFPAQASDPSHLMPGGTVFTCLSHDVIVHETTHALLDGLHRRFIEPTNPDSLAFHEAFADIVALFQHFSFPEVLRHQIGRTQGDLTRQNLLGELAYELGRATGARGALRSAIGSFRDGKWQSHDPIPGEYKLTTQPHTRGAHLVAAVFDAFLAIYKLRIAGLLRITTGTDLVNRLAYEAAKSSQHVLNMCIRALDYCPPIDLTFGEYLRALITADYDLVRDDDRSYRIAMIESFRRRGIFPEDVRTLSEASLRWHAPEEDEQRLLKNILLRAAEFCSPLPDWNLACERMEVFTQMRRFQEILEQHLLKRLPMQDPKIRQAFEILGLDPAIAPEELEVHSMRPARRIGPDGQSVVELIVEITQRLPGFWLPYTGKIPWPANNVGYQEKDFAILKSRLRTTGPEGEQEEIADFWVRGGCTILIDPNTARVRYVIAKSIANTVRFSQQAGFLARAGRSLRATYFGMTKRLEESEVFALLHRRQPEEVVHD